MCLNNCGQFLASVVDRVIFFPFLDLRASVPGLFDCRMRRIAQPAIGQVALKDGAKVEVIGNNGVADVVALSNSDALAQSQNRTQGYIVFWITYDPQDRKR